MQKRETPPWRWPSFSAVTAAAGLDDARARALWSEALVNLDGLEPDDIAAQLNTSARTIFRARAWIAANDAELWGKLRQRVGGLGYAPPRGRRS